MENHIDRENLVLLMRVHRGINEIEDICIRLVTPFSYDDDDCILKDLYDLNEVLKNVLHIGEDDESANFFYSLLYDRDLTPEEKADKLLAWQHS